jgi:signal transduction histidine kinase
LPLTTSTYPEVIADRIVAERVALAAAWLDRLRALLPVSVGEVFPTQAILDHIPELLTQVATYVRAPDAEVIPANSAVIDKARELGLLRHSQQASVHQLLREYEILAEILEEFVAGETERLHLRPSSATCLEAMRRLMSAVRALMRTTVDTFVSEYTATIQAQTEQLRSFSRVASHELRSPVGTILFAASLLQHEEVQHDAVRLSKVSRTIQANAERLRDLMTTLVRISSLDGPANVPNEQLVSLHTVAVEVARQLEDAAQARNVRIHIDPALPQLVVDPARLELVLLNLVSNALKYSDPAKPDRYVEIAREGESDATCTLLVRDNGIGIPSGAQSQVFKRFFRAHAELDSCLGTEGSGLGLAIVAECVEALRGTIRCESKEGQGTIFTLELPRRPS